MVSCATRAGSTASPSPLSSPDTSRALREAAGTSFVTPEVLELGGACERTMSRRTDYVVLGSQSADEWAPGAWPNPSSPWPTGYRVYPGRRRPYGGLIDRSPRPTSTCG